MEMEKLTMGNSEMVKDKGKENINIPMVIYFKESGLRIANKDMENCNNKMVTFIKANFIKIIKMEGDNTILIMEICTRDSLIIIKDMDKVHIHEVTVNNIVDIGTMIK